MSKVKVRRTVIIEYELDREDYGDWSNEQIVAYENSDDIGPEIYLESIVSDKAEVEFIA